MKCKEYWDSVLLDKITEKVEAMIVEEENSNGNSL